MQVSETGKPLQYAEDWFLFRVYKNSDIASNVLQETNEYLETFLVSTG